MRIVTNESNMGISASRNKGLALIETPYIATMDGDDISLPERLALQLSFMTSHPEIAAVGCQMKIFHKKYSQSIAWRAPTSPDALRQRMYMIESRLSHGGSMMRTAAIREAGGYREQFRSALDYDLWLRLLDKHDLCNQPETLLLYRQHAASISQAKTTQQVINHVLAMRSSECRRQGLPDPLDGKELTLELLLSLLDPSQPSAYAWARLLTRCLVENRSKLLYGALALILRHASDIRQTRDALDLLAEYLHPAELETAVRLLADLHDLHDDPEYQLVTEAISGLLRKSAQHNQTIQLPDIPSPLPSPSPSKCQKRNSTISQPFPSPDSFDPLLPPDAFDGPILWATYAPSMGGVEKQIIAEAKNIAPLLKPHLLCQPGSSESFLEQARPLFNRTYDLNSHIPDIESYLPGAHSLTQQVFGQLGGFANSCAVFAAFFAACRPRAVHVWNSDHVWISLAAILAGVPRVIARACSLSPARRYPYQFESIDDVLARQAFSFMLAYRGFRMAANSNAARTDYAVWLGIEPARIFLIPDILIPDEASRENLAARAEGMRKAWGIPKTAPVIGGLFRFASIKDPELWIRTAARALQDRPDAYAVICGNGQMYPMIAEAVKNSYLSGKLILPGEIRDVAAFHSLCDVHLITSHVEGLCNSVMEAQYYETPVISTACGGTDDIIKNGETGWIVEERSPEALADKLLFVLGNPEWAAKAGKAGKENMLHLFSPGRVTQSFLQPYHELGISTPVAEIFYPGSERLGAREEGVLWNGLECGNYYISAAEYKAFRDFIKSENIESILEFGAGQTTVLFKNTVQKQVALEGWNGPWLDFARKHDCNARELPFSLQNGFAEAPLKAAVAETLSAGQKSLVFIDSPPGTNSRSIVVDQVIRLAPDADYYAFHDSIRDAQIVYRLAASLGLKIVRHFHSRRGLTFLGREAISPQNTETLIEVEKIRFEVRRIHSGQNNEIHIEIKNVGKSVIPSGGRNAWRLTTHCLGPDGAPLSEDVPRYEFPVDLEPGDSLAFCLMLKYDTRAAWAIEFDLIGEEKCWWSQRANAPMRPRIELFDSVCGNPGGLSVLRSSARG
ncbi:MAG: glycosyltransferase [Zoogloeaceae bacterium]|nr:glycosyltransferase [Zoogloeaceae bacterium]